MTASPITIPVMCGNATHVITLETTPAGVRVRTPDHSALDRIFDAVLRAESGCDELARPLAALARDGLPVSLLAEWAGDADGLGSVRSWLRAGVATPNERRAWAERGFDQPSDIERITGCGVSLLAIDGWLDVGVTDSLDLRDHVRGGALSPTDVLAWRAVGATSGRAVYRWAMAGASGPQDVDHLRSEGVTEGSAAFVERLAAAPRATPPAEEVGPPTGRSGRAPRQDPIAGHGGRNWTVEVNHLAGRRSVDAGDATHVLAEVRDEHGRLRFRFEAPVEVYRRRRSVLAAPPPTIGQSDRHAA